MIPPAAARARRVSPVGECPPGMGSCTRQPTALFFNGYAPAKTLLVGGSLAGPVAGETRALACLLHQLSVSQDGSPTSSHFKVVLG